MNLLLLLVFCQTPKPQDEFTTRLASFVVAMNSFSEELAGCPKGTTSWDAKVCAEVGQFNAKKWESARREAAKLFRLVEPGDDVKNRSKPKRGHDR